MYIVIYVLYIEYNIWPLGTRAADDITNIWKWECLHTFIEKYLRQHHNENTWLSLWPQEITFPIYLFFFFFYFIWNVPSHVASRQWTVSIPMRTKSIHFLT